MSRYSNVSAVPLSLAVFLATDHYDHNPDPHTLSATALIKPLRQIVLSARVPANDGVVDLIQMMPSRMGTAIHDGIERAWKDNFPTAMETLGYPKGVIKQIRINPTKEELVDGVIPIYMEQRAVRKLGNFNISGKFDFVGDGRVEDFKSTSVYTAIHATNDDKYIQQGSIYRWLNPEIITNNQMAIQFIFTDWSRNKAMQDPKYPQQRIQQKILDLMSIQETEGFIKTKLNLIEKHWDSPEAELPQCSNDDLWRSDPVFKYYKNPEKTSRSTKNFDNRQDALIRLSEDGNVGIVKEQPGQVTACKYCNAFSVCSQKDALIQAGDLVL